MARVTTRSSSQHAVRPPGVWDLQATLQASVSRPFIAPLRPDLVPKGRTKGSYKADGSIYANRSLSLWTRPSAERCSGEFGGQWVEPAWQPFIVADEASLVFELDESDIEDTQGPLSQDGSASEQRLDTDATDMATHRGASSSYASNDPLPAENSAPKTATPEAVTANRGSAGFATRKRIVNRKLVPEGCTMKATSTQYVRDSASRLRDVDALSTAHPNDSAAVHGLEQMRQRLQAALEGKDVVSETPARPAACGSCSPAGVESISEAPHAVVLQQLEPSAMQIAQIIEPGQYSVASASKSTIMNHLEQPEMPTGSVDAARPPKKEYASHETDSTMVNHSLQSEIPVDTVATPLEEHAPRASNRPVRHTGPGSETGGTTQRRTKLINKRLFRAAASGCSSQVGSASTSESTQGSGVGLVVLVQEPQLSASQVGTMEVPGQVSATHSSNRGLVEMPADSAAAPAEEFAVRAGSTPIMNQPQPSELSVIAVAVPGKQCAPRAASRPTVSQLGLSETSSAAAAVPPEECAAHASTSPVRNIRMRSEVAGATPRWRKKLVNRKFVPTPTATEHVSQETAQESERERQAVVEAEAQRQRREEAARRQVEGEAKREVEEEHEENIHAAHEMTAECAVDSKISFVGHRVNWQLRFANGQAPPFIESPTFTVGRTGVAAQLRLRSVGDECELALRILGARPRGFRASLFVSKGWARNAFRDWPASEDLVEKFRVNLTGRKIVLCGMVAEI